MKRLLSLLTLLTTLTVAGQSFATTTPSCSTTKHTKVIKHTKYIKGWRHTTYHTSSVYESGNCSSCAVSSLAAADFYSTPLGQEYAREHGMYLPASVTPAPDLTIFTPMVTPVYVMPSNTILIPDGTYSDYRVRTTTVGGYTVTTTDNPKYYSLFGHHSTIHNTKGVDNTSTVGVSPRAGSMPESFGTTVKTQ